MIEWQSILFACQRFPFQSLAPPYRTRKDPPLKMWIASVVECRSVDVAELVGLVHISFLCSSPSTRTFACASPIGVNRNFTRILWCSYTVPIHFNWVCTEEHSDGLFPLTVVVKYQGCPSPWAWFFLVLFGSCWILVKIISEGSHFLILAMCYEYSLYCASTNLVSLQESGL